MSSVGFSLPRSALLLSGWLLVLSGCGGTDDDRPAPAATVVLVDPASGDAFRFPAGTVTPAAHPQTGAQTLVPAMYCNACKAWFPVPDMEQLHRQKGVAHCPKSGDVLQSVGPLPAAAGTPAAAPGADS